MIKYYHELFYTEQYIYIVYEAAINFQAIRLNNLYTVSFGAKRMPMCQVLPCGMTTTQSGDIWAKPRILKKIKQNKNHYQG